MALDEDGKILGLRVDALHDMGSHVFDASMVVPLFALKLAPGVYQIPAVHAAARAVLTNTPPLQPYRGAGRPEATYLIEQLLDEPPTRSASTRSSCAGATSCRRRRCRTSCIPASPTTAASSSG